MTRCSPENTVWCGGNDEEEEEEEEEDGDDGDDGGIEENDSW